MNINKAPLLLLIDIMALLAITLSIYSFRSLNHSLLQDILLAAPILIVFVVNSLLNVAYILFLTRSDKENITFRDYVFMGGSKQVDAKIEKHLNEQLHKKYNIYKNIRILIQLLTYLSVIFVFVYNGITIVNE